MPKDEHHMPMWTVEVLGPQATAKLNFFDRAASNPSISQQALDAIAEVLDILDRLRCDPFRFGVTRLAASEHYFESIVVISHGTLRIRFHVDHPELRVSVDVVCCRPCIRDLLQSVA